MINEVLLWTSAQRQIDVGRWAKTCILSSSAQRVDAV